jgi:hypothetical protein
MTTITKDFILWRIAGENLSENDAVYVSDGDAGRTAGYVYKHDVTNSDRRVFLGFVKEAVTTGNYAKISYEGSRKGFTGLTQNDILYGSITTPGGYQTTKPATEAHVVYLGNATSATEVMVSAQAGNAVNNASIGSSGGSGGGMIREVAQTSHGFSVLEPVYYNNTTDAWTSARADADSTLATHIITEVVDVDNFKCASGGPFEIASHGKAEGLWYVSKTTAGEVTQTAPTSGYDNIAFQVIDANNIEVITYYRPSLVTAGGASLWTAFGKFNGSGFEDGVNCTHSVVSTKSRLDFGTNEYPTGLNSGNPSGGALSVYIDGKRIPRYHDGSLVDTTGAYYKEISATVIELDQDYSSETVTIEVEYDVLITDSGTDHGTRITALEGDTVDLTTTQTVGGDKTFTGDNEFQGDLIVRGIGDNALDSLTTGTNNTAFGLDALTANTEGDKNTAIGDNTLKSNTTSDDNTAVGANALTNNTASENTAVGSAALLANTSGTLNTAVGRQAMRYTTTGDYNTAVGGYALLLNTTGENNSAFGYNALSANISGNYNTGIGRYSLFSNTVGHRNTALGRSSLVTNTTGSDNVSVGELSLASNVSGDNNVAVGKSALGNNTASNNTAVGMEALYANTSGANNTAVGYNALASTNYYNTTGLGYQSAVTGNDQVQLGDSSTTTYVYGTVQNRSDERDKADIQDTQLGLDFINKLRPVEYKWDMREDYRQNDEKLEDLVHDGTHKRNRKHQGFIAQEVKQVIDETGIDFAGYQDHSVSGGEDVLSLGYDEFIAPMVKAIQTLSEQNDAKDQQIAQLIVRIEALEKGV